MAKASVRTKILKSGARVRAAKHGETREQQKKWLDKMIQRGIPACVFGSEALLNEYCARLKATEKREALRYKLERQYIAGELVLKTKASKAIATA
jgi:hypothetical protein